MIKVKLLHSRLGQMTLALLAMLLLLSLPVSAQEPPDSPHLEVVMVIDDSGSMEQNDPTDLRLVAARLLITLLDVGDRVAVIRFADHSQVLTDFTRVDDEASKEKLLHQLKGFHSNGGTNIRDAIVDAKKIMNQSDSANQRFVVFLTDGMVDEPLRQETLDIARDLKAHILSVALGSETDEVFLQTLARSSQGEYFEANTALDLPAVYLKVLEVMQGRTVIGPGLVTVPGTYELPISPYARQVAFVAIPHAGCHPHHRE